MDILKIIKRLELIKSLIALDEVDELNIHIEKLRKFNLNKEEINIIKLIEDKSYALAIEEINNYINKNHQLNIYINPEIHALKLEAKSLEIELNTLSDEKTELEKLIHRFGVRHNQELGELILKILQQRKQEAKSASEKEEAEQDFNNYKTEYDINKHEVIVNLSIDEQKEIKEKYRKASKLCHPDVVNEEQKELATKLFAELNEAYEKNDLKRVSEILENLIKGNFFVSKSDAINEKQLLLAEIEKLRMKLKELKRELQTIKDSETYQTIITITDWDKYFEETKKQLTEQVKE